MPWRIEKPAGMAIDETDYQTLEAGAEEAAIIKDISLIAWRHTSLFGRFELRKQHTEINIEEIAEILQKEIG